MTFIYSIHNRDEEIRKLRNKLSKQMFGKGYDYLNDWELKEVHIQVLRLAKW